MAASGCEVAFLALPHGESARAAKELLRARLDRARSVGRLPAARSRRVYAQLVRARTPRPSCSRTRSTASSSATATPFARRAWSPCPAAIRPRPSSPLAPLLAARPDPRRRPHRRRQERRLGRRTRAAARHHFSEVGEGVRAYKVARAPPHARDRAGARAAPPARRCAIMFTPHLVPMIARHPLHRLRARPPTPTRPRARVPDGAAQRLRERAVRRRSSIAPPDTAHVRGSNRVHVAAWYDARAGRVIVVRRHRQPGQGRRRPGRAVPERRCAAGPRPPASTAPASSRESVARLLRRGAPRPHPRQAARRLSGADGGHVRRLRRWSRTRWRAARWRTSSAAA